MVKLSTVNPERGEEGGVFLKESTTNMDLVERC